MHVLNASESMRKVSGERIAIEAQQPNTETTVGMKVVCGEFLRSTQEKRTTRGTGSLGYMPPRLCGKGNRRATNRGRAAVEGRIEPAIPESTYEDQTQASFTQREESMPGAGESDGVEPGTPDSTEERTEGPAAFYY